jgi:hypothetical protein
VGELFGCVCRVGEIGQKEETKRNEAICWRKRLLIPGDFEYANGDRVPGVVGIVISKVVNNKTMFFFETMRVDGCEAIAMCQMNESWSSNAEESTAFVIVYVFVLFLCERRRGRNQII